MTPARGALDGAGASSVSPRRFLQLGPVRIDSVTQGEALDVVEALIAKGRGGAVFTPNVDHVMIAHEDPAMRSAYGRADLCIADGMPIVWASHLLRSPIPERVAGSDFVPLLLARSAARGWGVYLLGGAPGVGEMARQRLGEQLPDLKIVGVDSPRFDADEPLGRQAHVVERVRAAHPDLVLVAFGAPKQEISDRPCSRRPTPGGLARRRRFAGLPSWYSASRSTLDGTVGARVALSPMS